MRRVSQKREMNGGLGKMAKFSVKKERATELGVTLRDALQLVGFAFDAPFPRLEEARQRGKLGLAFQWQIIPRSQRRRQRLTGAAVVPVAVRVATWTQRQEKHF